MKILLSFDILGLVFDKLRAQFADYLSAHQVCVISTTEGDAWVMPVHYRNCKLEIECLIPRWTDVAYHLEQDPRACTEPGQSADRRVMVVIQDTAARLRWLQIWGAARPVKEPDWAALLPEGKAAAAPNSLYLVVRVTPKRMDLLDESQGWGIRETLYL